MIKLAQKEVCSGCGACYNICPQSCIDMKYDNEGFPYPVINKRICAECNSCVNVCPALNINHNETYNQTEDSLVFAAYNKNTTVRSNSSSGGIFTLIAQHIIKNGGVVFGAAFDNNMNVIHTIAKNPMEIQKLCSSKYVQSDTSDTFVAVKNYLNEGRWVMYTGTPCQISGLKSYLKKDYDRLICQDIICHGVPSPGIWNTYKNRLFETYSKDITEVNFRFKKYSWKNYHIYIKFGDGNVYNKPHKKDPYLQIFLKNIILRPSCYSCRYKNLKNISDITLGDFWGVDRLYPEMDDDKGTSLIYIHSKKGLSLWNAISQNTNFKEVNGNDIIKYNPSILHPASRPIIRERFFSKVSVKNIHYLSTVYNAVALLERIIRRLFYR